MIVIIKSLITFFLGFIISFIGYRKKSLSKSGFFFAIFIGFIHGISSFIAMASLMSFFISGSWVTKFGSKKKEKFDDEYREGGQRNWVQVLSNSCLSTLGCIVYISEMGIRLQDSPVNYQQNPLASMATIAVISSLASCCGDTFASEIGSAYSTSDPRLILGWRKVPRGTNGGISIIGTLASGIGGLFVGVSAYVTLMFTCNNTDLQSATDQWPIIAIAVLSGLIGSVIDSVLGATLQFSGLNLKNGKIVNQPGEHVKHISGVDILDNHVVNLLSSCMTGTGIAFGSLHLWPLLIQLAH